MSARRADRRRCLGVVAALAASCAVGPDYVRPDAPQETRYRSRPAPPSAPSASASAAVQRFATANDLAPEWWRLLASRQLDALVADALAHNLTLEGTEATLRRTEETLRAGYGIFFPQADLGLGASRQRYSPARVGSSLPPSVFNLFTLSASVSYSLDIWGGQRRMLEGLRAQVEAARYTLVGAQLILTANVVNTAIAIAGYGAEIEATRNLLELETEQVRLAEAQAQAGTLTYASVLGLKSQVAATRATLPPLEQKSEQAQHLLALLSGRSPAEWSPPAIQLGDLKLPIDIPISLPSQLVRQRPDVLVAEAQLHGSTAQIGVATAALLPNLTLTGNLGANNGSIAQLSSSNSLFWGLGAGLAQPLFHGGSLWYQRKAAIDARDQALASYRQTVLSAFVQVADALGALDHDAGVLAAETEALTSAEEALKLVKITNESGLANYLQVLTADGQYLQAKIGYVQAQAQRLQDTVALFAALGGGWWNARVAETGH